MQYWVVCFSNCSSNELVSKLREEQHWAEKILSDINRGAVNSRRQINIDKDADLLEAVNSITDKMF
jgi:hypothetical protein